MNKLSRFKIIDNLRRSLIPIFSVLNFIFLSVFKLVLHIKVWPFILISILSITISSILDLLNYIIFRKENIKVQKKFTKRIDGLLASIYRGIIDLGILPYKAWIFLRAIVKTIYRMKITKEHLLEWTTAEEAEKKNKNDIFSMYKNMSANTIMGLLGIILVLILDFSFLNFNYTETRIVPQLSGLSKTFITILSIIWILTPFLMWYISKPNKEKKQAEKLNKDEIDYIKDVAEKTWSYFEEYMNKENSFLPPDNFQQSRREKIVHRTSSTNIGLGLMTIISAYDFKFITLEKAVSFLENVMETIVKLDKWNGHLYNWYNTKTLNPLAPRYISTVDSGNFVRIYVYAKRIFRGKRKYTI